MWRLEHVDTHINVGIDVHVCMRYVYVYVHMHMKKYSLRYSHKRIWVHTCNVNAHIYIYIYTCAWVHLFTYAQQMCPYAYILYTKIVMQVDVSHSVCHNKPTNFLKNRTISIRNSNFSGKTSLSLELEIVQFLRKFIGLWKLSCFFTYVCAFSTCTCICEHAHTRAQVHFFTCMFESEPNNL